VRVVDALVAHAAAVGRRDDVAANVALELTAVRAVEGAATDQPRPIALVAHLVTASGQRAAATRCIVLREDLCPGLFGALDLAKDTAAQVALEGHRSFARARVDDEVELVVGLMNDSG